MAEINKRNLIKGQEYKVVDATTNTVDVFYPETSADMIKETNNLKVLTKEEREKLAELENAKIATKTTAGLVKPSGYITIADDGTIDVDKSIISDTYDKTEADKRYLIKTGDTATGNIYAPNIANVSGELIGVDNILPVELSGRLTNVLNGITKDAIVFSDSSVSINNVLDAFRTGYSDNYISITNSQTITITAHEDFYLYKILMYYTANDGTNVNITINNEQILNFSADNDNTLGNGTHKVYYNLNDKLFVSKSSIITIALDVNIYNIQFLGTTSGSYNDNGTYIENKSDGTTVLKTDHTFETKDGEVLTASTLPTASTSNLGAIKTGYVSNNKNYKLNVDSSGNAYVSVPWENVNDNTQNFNKLYLSNSTTGLNNSTSSDYESSSYINLSEKETNGTESVVSSLKIKADGGTKLKNENGTLYVKSASKISELSDDVGLAKKTDLPEVNNASIKFIVNGETTTFTANQKSDSTDVVINATKVEKSSTNGNILVDNSEVQVYDDTNVKSLISTETNNRISADEEINKLLKTKVDKSTLLSSGTDFDSIKTTGFYLVGETYTNGPTTGITQLIVSANESIITQLATSADVSKLYIRTGSDTFNGWAELSTTTDVKNKIAEEIAKLDVSEINGTVSKTLTSISEVDGKISATYSDIKISESQVTGLTDDLANEASARKQADSDLSDRIKANDDSIISINEKIATLKSDTSGQIGDISASIGTGALTIKADNGTTVKTLGTFNANSKTDVAITIKASDLDISGLGKLDNDTSGNAGSADKLSSSMTITVDGDASGTVTFDGSTNKTLSLDVSKAAALDSVNVGSNNKPVYFDEYGKPIAIDYEINKTVPADAKFTDTTYTVATTNKSGLLSAEDKAKLDSIESGAQVGSVKSVNTRTGDVVLTKSDVDLGNVENKAMDTTPTNNSTNYVTSGGVKSYVDAFRPYGCKLIGNGLLNIDCCGNDYLNKVKSIQQEGSTLFACFKTGSTNLPTSDSAYSIIHYGYSNNSYNGVEVAIAHDTTPVRMYIRHMTRMYQWQAVSNLSDLDSYLKLTGGTISGDLDITGVLSLVKATISNTPTNDTDVVNKKYVDDLIDDHNDSSKVDKTTTIAGLDLQDNITKEELLSSLGITEAVKFIGSTNTEISDGSDTAVIVDSKTVTPEKGNIVLYNHKEFIWTGSAWEELGDETLFANKSTSVKAGNKLTGGGTLENDVTISHASISTSSTSSKASPTHGKTFTAIDSLTSDGYGHITSYNVKTITLPDDEDHNQMVSVGTTIFGGNDVISIEGQNNITVTADTTEKRIIIDGSHSHNDYVTKTTTIAGLDLADNITATEIKNNVKYSFSDLTAHPTTLSGYGITDAKIENGKITLGNSSITPLTAHQDLSGYVKKITTIAGIDLADNITATELANKLSFDTSIAASTETSQISLKSNTTYSITSGNTSYVFTTPVNTDTHYDAKLIIGSSSSDKSTISSSTNNPYINLIENNTVRSSYNIKGSGSTTVSTDGKGNIVISSTDNDTKYSAGNGLSLLGTQFNVNTSYTTSGKNYAVKTDSDNNLYVNVPWSDTDTHYKSLNIIGSNTGTANSAVSNPYINHVENNAITSSHQIKGSGATTVSSDTSGNLTINTSKVAGTDLGLVKSTTTGTTANRNYNVEVNSDGTMKVNVPWTDTHYTNAFIIQGNGTDAVIFSQDSAKTLNITGSNNISIKTDTENSTITVDGSNLAAADHNHDDVYVNVSGDTMTGKLTAPQIETGTDSTSYFQSRRFRGQGNASEYRHAIDFGYAGHDRVDFYEYGGIYNFWQNTSATATTAVSNRVASLQLGKLLERGNTLTYPGKSGTFALTSDIDALNTNTITPLATRVENIENKIPASATSDNQLVAKDYVDSATINGITAVSSKFTGSVSVNSVSYTPEGTVSVTPTTSTVKTLSTNGTLPTFKAGTDSYTPSSFTQGIDTFDAGSEASITVTDDGNYTATLHWNSGTLPSFTQGTDKLTQGSFVQGKDSFTAGSLATFTDKSVVTGATAKFVGSTETIGITGSVTGSIANTYTKEDISVSYAE